MFPNGQGGYGPFVTFRQLMSVLLSHTDATTEGIIAYGGTRRGFSFKRPGTPTTGIVFRQDGNELYLDAWGQGDSVHRIAGGEEMSVATVLAVLYQETLKQGGAASLSRQRTP